MRLTAKFLLAFVITSLIALSASAYLEVQLRLQEFDEDMRQDLAAHATALARTTSKLAEGSPASAMAGLLPHRAGKLYLRLVRRSRLPDAPGEPEDESDHVRFVRLRGKKRREGFLYAYAPVEGALRFAGFDAIEVGEPLKPRDDFRRTIVRSTIYTIAIAFVATSVVAALVGFWLVATPLRAVRDKLRSIGAGDLSSPLSLVQRDEIGEIAREINQMSTQLAKAHAVAEAETAARIATLEQLRHADRLATVGRLAAGLAHEVGTPLAVIAGRSKMIASGEVTEDDARASAEVVAKQAGRITDLVRQLLDFSRKRAAAPAQVSLPQLCRKVEALMQPLAKKRAVALRMVEPRGDSLTAHADLVQVEQVLNNLVMNAIQACGEGGVVALRLGRCELDKPAFDAPSGSYLTVAVEDNGVGMDEDTLRHVFEPFYTTKGVGEGTGLGLAIAHGLMQENGGFIEVQSEKGHGARFTLFIPAADLEKA